MLRNRISTRDGEASPPASEKGTTETKSLATPHDTKGAADKSSSKSSSSSDSSSSSSKKSNTEILKAERDRIIGLSYKYGGTNTTIEVKSGTSKANGKNKSWVTRTVNNAEIVDIVNDYPWILDNTVAKGSEYTFSAQVKGGDAAAARAAYNKKSKVPVCYISERKSVVNSSISNILSLISTINDVGQTLTSVSNSTSGMMSDIAAGGSSIIKSFKEKVSAAIKDYLPGFSALLAQNNLNDEILNPYRFLYITADTGKRYVFPLTSKESSCFITSKNAWGEPKGGVPKALKAIFDTVNSFQTEIAGFTNLGKNIFSLTGTGENADDNGTVKEVAKTFSYPTKGDAINIQFTLYNTTRKNAWRDNFRFLYLFAVRNLPFRTEMMSFTPPLLYDIIVPGIKRLPICALSQMKVDPLGITRTLECDNFISGSGKIPVNVPEAWSIQLTFECLIAPSANLMLANTIGELNIDVASDFETQYTEEEAAETADKLSTEQEEMQKLCESIDKSKKFDTALKEIKNAKAAGYAKRFAEHISNAFNNLNENGKLFLFYFDSNNKSYYVSNVINHNAWVFETESDGFTLKYPIKLSDAAYVRVVEKDEYLKTVLQQLGVSEGEMTNGAVIRDKLEPFIGNPKKGDFRTGNEEAAGIRWQIDASVNIASGKVNEKQQQILLDSLEASGNDGYSYIWHGAVSAEIAKNKSLYPTISDKDSGFKFDPTTEDGIPKPEGYLDESAREEAEKKIREYNANLANAQSLGLNDSKLSIVCPDLKPAAKEQPES